MTFEEFKSEAITPKIYTETYVYKVTTIGYNNKDSFPEFDIFIKKISFHLSLIDAKTSVNRQLKEFSPDSDIYGIYISQHPVDKRCSPHDYEKLWVYDNKGEIIDESCCPKMEDGEQVPFRGRSLDKIRFNPGDLVEVVDLSDHKARLAVVVSVPISIEKAWEINSIAYRKNARNNSPIETIDDKFFFLDGSDDIYTVLFLKNNGNPDKRMYIPSTSVFPLHKEVPRHVKDMFYHKYTGLIAGKNSNHTTNIISGKNDNLKDEVKEFIRGKTDEIPKIKSPDEVTKLMEDLWVNHKAGNNMTGKNVYMVQLPPLT